MTYYDEIADGYDALHKDEQLRKLAIIKEHLLVKPKDRLLDVGCGTGFSFEHFDCECHGIDPSEELLRRCKVSGVTLTKANAENIPYLDNYFDIVISLTAIQNFKDIEQGLSEIRRVGKRRFALSVLKKSSNLDVVDMLINDMFSVDLVVDEGTDMIYFILQSDD